MKKKSIVAVFAHPDDEAFGPSGTLNKLSKDYDVYILCATRGEAGQNHSGKEDPISKMREEELLESAKIIGVKKVHFLDFIDGELNNNTYHKLADKIKEYLEKIQPETVITFENRGISGHIDHIVVSMATSFVVQKLSFVKKIMYYCLSEEQRSVIGDYFIFFPPGYTKDQINHIVDITDVFETKLKAMFAHKSQIKDAQNILKRNEKLPKREHFMVKKLHQSK